MLRGSLFEYFLRVAMFSTSVKSIVLNQGAHVYWTTPYRGLTAFASLSMAVSD
ncbi:MAG: hypothetical protein KZQ59_16615 [Candidatus Thiodiazotropha sp. (ex Lucinoma aequizonata)]|nr:hypothetical protein [Candidatus Thiodiazotropha sp. (ex Lucinoma aequizonata)]MCU7900253.1 hypothetical protein [Candidatus Thiodiazotropha sp. (ex Lucinoma aequizonata)]